MAISRRNSILSYLTAGSDTPDLIRIILCEPEVAIRACRYAKNAAIGCRNRVLSYLTTERDLSDLVRSVSQGTRDCRSSLP